MIAVNPELLKQLGSELVRQHDKLFFGGAPSIGRFGMPLLTSSAVGKDQVLIMNPDYKTKDNYMTYIQPNTYPSPSSPFYPYDGGGSSKGIDWQFDFKKMVDKLTEIASLPARKFNFTLSEKADGTRVLTVGFGDEVETLEGKQIDHLIPDLMYLVGELIEEGLGDDEEATGDLDGSTDLRAENRALREALEALLRESLEARASYEAQMADERKVFRQELEAVEKDLLEAEKELQEAREEVDAEKKAATNEISALTEIHRKVLRQKEALRLKVVEKNERIGTLEYLIRNSDEVLVLVEDRMTDSGYWHPVQEWALRKIQAVRGILATGVEQ